jgi:hypothetical protein
MINDTERKIYPHIWFLKWSILFLFIACISSIIAW